MKLIYCSSPINNRIVESDYENEYKYALENGFDVQLINFEELLNKNIEKTLKNITRNDNTELAIFRGWMLKPEYYELLYNGLKDKNIKLINNTDEYINCHYFPDSYEIIKENSPKSIWFEIKEKINFDEVMEKLKIFNGKSIIIKDYVKSQKHKWKEACFINSSNDKNEVTKIVNKFIELQGTELNKGLVFREYHELEFIGEHSKSKMPLTKEYRMFFLNGELINKYNYWDEGFYSSELNNLTKFISIASKIKSNFFTMDIAKTVNGEWLIIELGDAQVSGLPDNADLNDFYSKLFSLVKNSSLKNSNFY